MPLVRRVCQGAFVVVAHAGARALRRRRGASSGARAQIRVRAVLAFVERRPGGGGGRQGRVERAGGDVGAAARLPGLDDRLGVRQIAARGVGGGRPDGARAGHAAARTGRPVLLGARDRRGRARVAPRRVRRPVRDRDRRPDPALRRQAGKTAGHGAGPFRPGAARMDARARGDEFTRRVGVVAMDAFAGWKQAVESVVPHAVEVIDPFHVVQLAAARVTKVRCRLQCDATGRRGVRGDRLYDCRRALLTSDEYLGARGRARLMALFAIETNRDLMLAHDAYQRVIHAYRCDGRRRGERMMRALIDDLNESPRYGGCRELTSLGRVLRRRMHDILALFRHHYSSNGPTEAINGRIETLRGNAMGFANTTSYIQRCLIHSSQLKDILTH